MFADLTATKFPETGFGNPTIEATVTSDGGKPTETVRIAKSGNGYLAKRENKSGLYELESGSVDDLQNAADVITARQYDQVEIAAGVTLPSE